MGEEEVKEAEEAKEAEEVVKPEPDPDSKFKASTIVVVAAIVLFLIGLYSFVIKPAMIKDDRAVSTFFDETKDGSTWRSLAK